MGQLLDTELRSLLAYYGEIPNKADSLKPEDFFELILTFSSSLQVCDLCGIIAYTNHNRKQKAAVEVYEATPTLVLPIAVTAPGPDTEPEPETVCKMLRSSSMRLTASMQTVKGLMVPTMNSQGRAAGGRQTLSRGDLDQAIRSMRDGKRRARPDRERPLSKIFLDGGRPTSRVFD